MPAPDFQRRVLNTVVNAFSKKSQAVDHLASLLDISPDGIYRRINGQTVLSADELALIARDQGQSLDSMIMENSQNLIFTYNQFPKQVRSFEDYFNGVARNLRQFAGLQELQVYYTSHEIPVFLYYAYPRLLSFKLYMYGLTVWTFPQLENKKFSFDLLPQNILETASHLADIYATMPTHSLWEAGILENTLNQLEYLAEVEGFENPGDALQICEELNELIDHLKGMAEGGKKYPRGGRPSPQSGDFLLFYNQFSYTNNSILAILPDRKVLFITIHHPNFLRTTNPTMCDLQKYWFERMMKTSISISVHSARERERFFNRLKRKVLQTQETLEMLIRRTGSW